MNTMDLAKGKNWLAGSTGDDVLRGNDIDDTIQGNGGNDQIWGGIQGNDTLVGGSGSTGYWWGHDDGSDTIRSQNASDALIFYGDTSAGHQSYYSGNDLKVYYNTASQLTLKDWKSMAASQRLQNFVWNENGTWIDYLWNAGGSAKGDLSVGSLAYNNVHYLESIDGGDNTLVGSSGDDQLLGYAGNNQLWGGLGGDDLMVGRGSSEGFWWGSSDGNDTVISTSRDDAMIFYGNSLAGHNAGYDANGSLYFNYNSGSRVTIQSWSYTDAQQRIQNFVYNENGTMTDYVWNAGSDAVVNLYAPSLARNNIHRAISLESANVTFRGSIGDDYLQGGAGNDQLWGGTGGNDTLFGGAGADTYWCGTHGNTVILNDARNSADTIFFYDEKRTDLTFSRSGNDIIMSGHGKTTRLENGLVNQIGTLRFVDGSTMTGSQLVSLVSPPTTPPTRNVGKKAFVFSVSEFIPAQGCTTRWGSKQVDPAFAQKLANNGWQVSGIYNTVATPQNTYNALRNFANTVQANDNVMLLLSSHGSLNMWNHQELSDCFSLAAYGNSIGINLKGRTYTSHINSDTELDLASSLETISNRAGSGGHVTIFMDACHSGAVASYADEKGFSNMTVLASCRHDQESLGEGWYTSTHNADGKGFVSYTEQALSGAADSNHDGYVSVQELGSYEGYEMSKYSRSMGYSPSTVTCNSNYHPDYKYSYLV